MNWGNKEQIMTVDESAKKCCNNVLRDWEHWIMVGGGEYESTVPIYRRTREVLGEICLYPPGIPYLCTTGIFDDLRQKGHKQGFVLPVSDPVESVRLLKAARIDVVAK